MSDGVERGAEPENGRPGAEPSGSGEADAAEAASAAGADAGVRRRRGRIRAVAAFVVGAVAVVLLEGAVVGGWTLRTALDSDRFEDQIADVLREEEVSDALARVVVREATAGIDLRTPLVDLAPEVAEPLVDVLLAGVEARLVDRVGELIRTPAVADGVAVVAGRAHGLAVDVLEGEKIVDRVDVVDDEVRLNLVPLTARALTAVQEFGLLRDVEVPELDPAGDPSDHIVQLEAALGVDLADDFAQPTVFRSEALENAGTNIELARSVLLLAKRAVWILAIAGLAAAAGAIALSRRRWRAAALLVGAVVVVAAATSWVTDSLVSRAPDAVTEPGARATVTEIVGDLRDSLQSTLSVYALIAIIGLAIAGFIRLRWPAAFRDGD